MIKNQKNTSVYWASTIEGQFTETQSEEEKDTITEFITPRPKISKVSKKPNYCTEPGFNVIDSSILKDENGYIMFLKDEKKVPVQKNLKIATSKKLEGPYTKASEPITGKYWAEGPTSNPNKWPMGGLFR